jgi:hypothetical protein
MSFLQYRFTHRLCRAAAFLTLSAACAGTASGQYFRRSITRSAAIGFASEPSDGDGGIRSTIGATGELALGYHLLRRLVVQTEVAGSAFDRPAAATSPCRQPGCTIASDVTELSVGGTAIVLPQTRSGGELLFGGGIRRLIHDPANPHSAEPYFEGGVGATMALGLRSAWFVEARYQGTLGPRHAPTYLVPITVGVRF